MNLSIVTTLYQSASHLDEFHRRVSAAARSLADDYEIILVNDGSPDSSLETALALRAQDERVKVIDLSRNFGHHKAIMTGLAQAEGDLVFLIDCDLEEDPELLNNFHEVWKNSGADVVYGVQPKRKGGWGERISGYFFYRVFNFLSPYPVPANVLTARLMTRTYVTQLVEHKDREVFLLGLWAITGFKQVPVPAEKHSRSPSTYSLGRRLSILVNAVTSFSNKPLVYVFHLGCLISGLACLAALYLILRRLFFGEYLAGWPSLIVSIWLLGGLTIFCLGILGIYLSKIFMETKPRPYTVIRRIYGRRKGGEE
jgi:putative glycosyltransferase